MLRAQIVTVCCRTKIGQRLRSRKSDRRSIDGALPSKAITSLPVAKTGCRNLCSVANKIRNESSTREATNGEDLVLFDSLTSTHKAVSTTTTTGASSSSDKGLAWYTCGPTVYDSAHLGHARTYVCLDIIRRLLVRRRSGGGGVGPPPPPLFVMNVTDVDDKILARSKERNVEPLRLAREFEKEFFEDLESLNVLPPTVVTRVSEHVTSDIVPYVAKIIENNMAYVIENDNDDDGNGGVYFDVRSFEKSKKYGKLAPSNAARECDVFFETGDAPKKEKGGKRDDRDFALWKFKKEGETLFWDSPWGEGRPGWHIECSAMIEAVTTMFESSHTLQVHAGGVDLKFPHHTNEIAQAEAFHLNRCGNQEEWIPHWVHTGHLHIDGSKMSKSLKNFITVRQFLKDGDDGRDTMYSSTADDFRLWCLGLSGSYRGLATYSKNRLEEARSIREKIVRFLLEGNAHLDKLSGSSSSAGPAVRKWRDADHNLYEKSVECARNCDVALYGKAERDGPTFDMDGSTFVKELVRLSELGSSYCRTSSSSSSPPEPLRHSLSTVADLLALVGFSSKTTLFANPNGDDGNDDGTTMSSSLSSNHRVAGGEVALVEEIAEMRRRIRSTALRAIKKSGGKTAKVEDDEEAAAVSLRKSLSEILRVCDEARDVTLPSLGVEVFDNRDGDNDGDTADWRWCVPRTVKQIEQRQGENAETDERERTSPVAVDVENLFRGGKYDGLFSEYDELGIPTIKSDGSDVSKSQRKKFAKIREKVMKKRGLTNNAEQASEIEKNK